MWSMNRRSRSGSGQGRETQRIGHIRLTEKLGEGGMGTVWRGYDEKLRRDVAVKTLRADRLDLQTRARLLAEARILSQLEHPNVCRLYDYVEGEESDYLVLELIQGQTLGAWIAAGLADTDKLRIAEEIARALVVAHARGIVHRDLKPSNIMLAESDTARRNGSPLDPALPGQVKVLDFGLARSFEGLEAESSTARPPPGAASHRTADAADGTLADDTLTLAAGTLAAGTLAAGTLAAGTLAAGTLAAGTLADGTLTRFAAALSETGRVTGTPAYMSPEQARGEGATAASDMYSFGLLLQELFTGQRAYPADISFALLLVKAGSGDTSPAHGVRRDVRSLIERLLALAPEQRPAASETVALLTSIRDRPKRRRRWWTAALILALFVSGVFKYAYDQKRGRAREAEARQEAEQATAFLADLFLAANPWSSQGKEPTVREVLDRGRDRLAEELMDQPRVRRRLLNTLGNVYDSLGHYREAEEILTEALEVTEVTFGPDSMDAALTLHVLAMAVHRQGRLNDAEPLYRRALEIHESLPGKDPIDMAALLYQLANIYDEQGDPNRPGPLYQRALDILDKRPDIRDRDPGAYDAKLSTLLLDMAVYYRNLGQDDRAERLLRRCLEIRERMQVPAGIAEVLNSLARVYVERGDPARGKPLFERALEVGDPALGAENNLMLALRRNFASLLLQSGELQRAESLLNRVIESRRRNHHRDDVIALNSYVLAEVYSRQGRYREAEALLGEALTGWIEARGENHPRTGTMLAVLAAVRRARGAPQEAEELFERAAGIFSRAFGEDDRYLTDVHLQLAGLALERGDGDRALALLRRARESTLRRLEGKPQNVLEQYVLEQGRLAAASLTGGDMEAARGALREAEEHWQDALTVLESITVELFPGEIRQTRALVLLRLGRTDEARPLIDELLATGWRDAELIESARAAQP